MWKIGSGNLSQRISRAEIEEIQPLVDAFNSMAEDVETSSRDLTRMSSILEATTDFVGIADVDGRSRYVNQAGLDMVGMPRDIDVSTTGIPDFHPPWAASLIQEIAIPAAISSGAWQGESALLKSDGSEIPVSQVILAHRDEAGEVAYFSTVCRDTTETRELYEARARTLEMEQALRVQEQEQANLASLADSTAAGLVMIGANGEISYYSAQVGEILGKAPQDLLTNQASLEGILSQSAEDQDATLAKFRGLSVAADSSRTANLVLALPRKKVLRCSMFPVRDANNRDLGKGLLLSDITKEFEVEQMKDEFIGIASHELRTPLTGVQGFAELLSESLDANSREQEWAGRINSEAKRPSDLVSDLLDASRLDSKSVVLHSESFALDDCVNETVRRVLAGRTPEREVLISADAPIEIEADHGKLSQALTNLVDNALKYSPDNQPVEVTYTAQDGRLRLEVHDHGQGIAHDHSTASSKGSIASNPTTPASAAPALAFTSLNSSSSSWVDVSSSRASSLGAVLSPSTCLFTNHPLIT